VRQGLGSRRSAGGATSASPRFAHRFSTRPAAHLPAANAEADYHRHVVLARSGGIERGAADQDGLERERREDLAEEAARGVEHVEERATRTFVCERRVHR